MRKDDIEIMHMDYCGKPVRLKDLKLYTTSFKSISYNPENNDKFVASIDTTKNFIHIYEFMADNQKHSSKYVHCIYDREKNCIIHMDYSVNTYEKEEYLSIIKEPNKIYKAKRHIKIWRVEGEIDLKMFYRIIFALFIQNKRYISELFSDAEKEY